MPGGQGLRSISSVDNATAIATLGAERSSLRGKARWSASPSHEILPVPWTLPPCCTICDAGPTDSTASDSAVSQAKGGQHLVSVDNARIHDTTGVAQRERALDRPGGWAGSGGPWLSAWVCHALLRRGLVEGEMGAALASLRGACPSVGAYKTTTTCEWTVTPPERSQFNRPMVQRRQGHGDGARDGGPRPAAVLAVKQPLACASPSSPPPHTHSWLRSVPTTKEAFQVGVDARR